MVKPTCQALKYRSLWPLKMMVLGAHGKVGDRQWTAMTMNHCLVNASFQPICLGWSSNFLNNKMLSSYASHIVEACSSGHQQLLTSRWIQPPGMGLPQLQITIRIRLILRAWRCMSFGRCLPRWAGCCGGRRGHSRTVVAAVAAVVVRCRYGIFLWLLMMNGLTTIHHSFTIN